jgi:hypothetical protein
MLDFAKNIFPPLEPKLLLMLERISEALQVFVKCCTLYSAYGIGTRECAAHHGVALEPFSAN